MSSSDKGKKDRFVANEIALAAGYPLRWQCYAEFLDYFGQESFDYQSAIRLQEMVLAGEFRLDKVTIDLLEGKAKPVQGEEPFKDSLVGQSMRSFLRTLGWEEWLKENEIIMLTRGLPQGNDPKNFDAGLSFCYIGENDYQELDLGKRELINDLTLLWQRVGFGRDIADVPHGWMFSLTDFLPEALMNHSQFDPEKFEAFCFQLTEVLSDEPVFPEHDSRKLIKARDEATVIAESDPLLCSVVNFSLQEMLAEREKRIG